MHNFRAGLGSITLKCNILLLLLLFFFFATNEINESEVLEMCRISITIASIVSQLLLRVHDFENAIAINVTITSRM